MKKLLIEIDDEVAEELEKVAPSRSRKRSEFIRMAIRKALWELEERATAEAYERLPDTAEDEYVDQEVWQPASHQGTRQETQAVRQYELRWVEMPEPIGRRPVMLLSRTPAYEYLAKVVVAEVTTTIREIPEEVRIGRREGLARPSVINLDNIHVVAKKRLGDRIGSLSPRREPEIKRALGYALDWPELKILG